MSTSVNSNIGSMIVNHNLQKAAGEVRTTMQRLSTGVRINSAADDAAGLSLSQKMQTQINASDIAKSNAQTGINLLQTMDSDMSQIGSLLQRMRELAVQSMNGVYSAAERTALDTENDQLIAEITRISTNSKFSGINLLSATATVALQVGTDSGTDNQISITTFASSAANLLVSTNDLTSVANATTAMNNCDTAINTVSARRASVGANINRLQGTMERVDARKINLQAANSTISDADIATESAALTRNQILQQAATSMLLQANQMPSLALKLIS